MRSFQESRKGWGKAGRGGFGELWQGLRTIVIVIAHDDLFRLPIFAHLAPEVFVEGIKVILQLRGVHLIFGVIGRVLVEVWEENGLGVRGLDVFSRAAITVATGSNLVVK